MPLPSDFNAVPSNFPSGNPPSGDLPVEAIAPPDSPAPVSGEILGRGDRIIINGIALGVPWARWQSQGREVFGLSDVALRSLGGIDLLNTDDPFIQPVAWRDNPLQDSPQVLELPALVTPQARYLDLTPLKTTANWSVQLTTEGETGERLKIQTRSLLQTSNLLLGRALGHVFGPHDIQWSPGIRWRQQYLRQGGAEFPVTELRFRLGAQDNPASQGNPDSQGNPASPARAVTLAPIWPADEDIAGIAPMVQTATVSQVAAAINGGFFNRNNQTPLGAIRQNGRWISGPILNRGAIAWDDQGNVAMDRLQLQETLVVSPPQPNLPNIDPNSPAAQSAAQPPGEASPSKPTEFDLISLNSGYLKAGFSRYTQDWGSRYVPLTDNEVLIYVKNGQVIEQRETQLAGEGQFPIPQGNPLVTFLVVARSNRTGAAKLPPGTQLRLEQQLSRPALTNYPHVLGGGPLLLQEGQVVLDATAEGFSRAFINERAPRSAAVAFADGELALVTVHERIGGRGPTLAELAAILQAMGAEEALNLDGGSSTQLLLGGQIINRNPRSAARVHNGLGLFQSP